MHAVGKVARIMPDTRDCTPAQAKQYEYGSKTHGAMASSIMYFTVIIIQYYPVAGYDFLPE